MKSLSQLNITSAEQDALLALKAEINKVSPLTEVVLFGSKARGDSRPDSDIDILLICAEEIYKPVRGKFSAIKFGIELRFNVIIGMLVHSRRDWDSELSRISPLHTAIDHEGILV